MADMNFADLEVFYERLATAIDEAGAEKTDLFLTKLSLLLANKLGDKHAALDAIEIALKDIS
ncbi:MAG: DUF2783 domain-containing protein [Parvularculaceae bacterium]